jgi:uncharacterized protein YdhG (YjbR/CyaY superfamily)
MGAMTNAGREIEAYLEVLPRGQRNVLQRLRQTIRAAVPDATEVISYGVPTFKQSKAVVSYGAAKNHCALYVMSTAVVDAHAEELASYDTAKGTVRFGAAKPLPDALVTKLVRARVAENAAAEQAAMERRRARNQNPQKDAPQ